MSSSESSPKPTSSRVSARERLQLLGIGLGTVNRFSDENHAHMSLDSTGSNARTHYPDISEIYHESPDGDTSWDSETQDFTHGHVAEALGSSPSAESVIAASASTNTAAQNGQAETYTARRRRIAARQLRNFRTFSLSIVAVLICSFWMFGYVMFS